MHTNSSFRSERSDKVVLDECPRWGCGVEYCASCSMRQPVLVQMSVIHCQMGAAALLPSYTRQLGGAELLYCRNIPRAFS